MHKFRTIIKIIQKVQNFKGGIYMTNMRRVTISIPEEIDKKVLELKKNDKFVRSSYSEIVRMLLLSGIEKNSKEVV